MGDGAKSRQDEWTDNIAEGSRSFVENVIALLDFTAKGRDAVDGGEGYQLREEAAHYKALFGVEKNDTGLEDAYRWDVTAESSGSYLGPTPGQPTAISPSLKGFGEALTYEKP